MIDNYPPGSVRSLSLFCYNFIYHHLPERNLPAIAAEEAIAAYPASGCAEYIICFYLEIPPARYSFLVDSIRASCLVVFHELRILIEHIRFKEKV
jgi:hypothetical protein